MNDSKNEEYFRFSYIHFSQLPIVYICISRFLFVNILKKMIDSIEYTYVAFENTMGKWITTFFYRRSNFTQNDRVDGQLFLIYSLFFIWANLRYVLIVRISRYFSIFYFLFVVHPFISFFCCTFLFIHIVIPTR